MQIGRLWASLALAGLLLGGCSGDSYDAVSGGSVIAPGGTSPGSTANRATFTIPANGGTVDLPTTSDIAGRISFAPGAQANTQMTVSVSETPIAGAIPIPTQSGLSYKPFWYMTVEVDKPFDLALVQSIALTDRPNDRESVPSTVEQYNMPVAEVGGGVVHHLDGAFDPATASFSNARPFQLQTGKAYQVQAQGIDHQTMQLALKNNSEFQYAYYTIIGQDATVNSTNPNFFYVDAGGQLTPLKTADRIKDTIIDITPANSTQKYFAGFCNYGQPFPPAGTNVTLPQMRAGRVFICLTNLPPETVNASVANGTAKDLGQLLLIRTEDPIPPLGPNPASINLVQPNGWGLVGERNYNTLFDWVEFDYKESPDSKLPGMGVNKTEVDMFGFGLQVGLTSANGTTQTVGTVEGGRKLAFDEIEANPAFKTLLINATNTPIGTNTTSLKWLRAIAPKQGISNVVENRPTGGTFSPTYLDAYITQVWNKYKTDTLTVYTSAFGTYTGKVNDKDEMVLSSPTFIDLIFKKPTTTEALEPTDYQSTKSFFSPSPGASPVVIPPPPPLVPAPRLDNPNKSLFPPYVATEFVSALSAAFNRSTLLLENFVTRDYLQHPATLSLFYNDTAGNITQPVNHYAKIIHKHSLPTKDAPGTPPSGGAAYAFGFDDNSNQSSFIGDNNSPTALSITVGKVNQ